ncbi:glycosyltransferase family 9 protein [Scleromatobacter humisilvae]|uniref:Glycosyltransferase family 9 protein n=1 Tax=Scleromatobacter humisilvae TaxID=2897159 RepID=A0A9X1YJZ1_9BURK|nr:glycosyltransferase family 9 protein [Scleromatobacter humisilvae]MCK9687087.1 glycosyltransferase family 9 protein [Scleromatobacter humisilvae]
MTVDTRPRTAVLHQWVGMGDLVWHAPYIRRIAETSRDGQVTVIASPTTFARQLIGHEPCVREIIDFDRHPRREEKRRGRHRGTLGLWRMGVELRPYGFDRIILLTNHTNRTLVAVAAGIPQRLGYGTSWLQRRLLTSGPWIKAYSGPAVTAYKDVTAFAIAHGFADAPVVPSLVVRQDALAHAGARLAGLPRPLHALAIGASEPYKQWGVDNFVALATRLAREGHGVVLVAGPAEREIADATLHRIAADLRGHVRAITDGTVAETVATMSLVQTCIGNDTGAVQIAAAVGTPSWVVLGPRPPLEHDPGTLHLIVAKSLAEIRPEDVAQRVLESLPASVARS